MTRSPAQAGFLAPFVAAERPHQGKGNGLLSPLASQEALGTQLICTREILSGLLKFYDPKAG